MKLKDIAAISLGATFPARVETVAAGGVRLIQMRDIGEDHIVHFNRAARAAGKSPKPAHLVQKGDILFRSRGQNNTAAIVKEEAENTIVAAPLLRVRAHRQKALPEFLLWWINQPTSQNFLSARARGTAVQMVGKRDLENLEVQLPPLKQQQKIARFFDLSQQERGLMEKIKVCRAQYAQGVLMRMVFQSI